MGTRLDEARRLELSDAVETAEGIDARLGPQRVTLVDDGAQRTLRFPFALPLQRLELKTADVNDPDVLFTGDDAFDDAVLVLPSDGHRQQWAPVFADAQLRRDVLTLLRRFPDAKLRDRALVVPGVALDAKESRAALEAGAVVVSQLERAFAAVGKAQPLEHNPQVPTGAAWLLDAEGGRPLLVGAGGVAVFAALLFAVLEIDERLGLSRSRMFTPIAVSVLFGVLLIFDIVRARRR